MTAAQLALAAFCAAANVLAFALYAVDKRRARLRGWRIRESILLAVAALGGSLGALLGMHLLHHKTKHYKFYFTVSAAFFVQVFLYTYLWWRFS